LGQKFLKADWTSHLAFKKSKSQKKLAKIHQTIIFLVLSFQFILSGFKRLAQEIVCFGSVVICYIEN